MVALICKTVIILFYYTSDLTIGLEVQGSPEALCSEVQEHDSGYYQDRIAIMRRTL